MKRLLITAAVVLLLVSTNFAQTFSIGPNVGYVKTKDADKGTYLFGAAARFNFLSFGIEGTIHYAEQKYYNDLVKVQQYPISVSGMFFPLPFVYGCAGLDWFNSRTTIDIAGSATETYQEVGYHFGAGAQFSLGGVYLTGDARYVLLGKMKVPNSSEIDNSNLVLSVGLLFKF
jgi:hypothetical protein